MIIKQLINKSEAWEDFKNFCLRSKPYKAFCIGSRHMREQSIKRCFDQFCEGCEVYECENVYVFTVEQRFYNHIQFLFGGDKDTNLSKIKKFYLIMDNIRSKNGKYFKSEIRRTFKVDFYKKWIDRYDKRAIILNNEDQTVLWYNCIKMKTLKIVATNKVSRHLQDKIVSYDKLDVECGSSPCISYLKIEEDMYIFDAKTVEYNGDHSLISGLISDDKSFVAAITLEFRPQ